MRNYRDGPHGDLGVYVHKVLSAWAEVWTGSWPSRASIMVPELRVAIWTIFEILGGLMISTTRQVQPTSCLKLFCFLCTYPRKVFSAWAEVWVPTLPSTASIMAPGGRDLGDF